MRTPLAAALSCAALLGCSDSGNGHPRTGAVTVTVTSGAPVAGAPVVFHRPDGTVQDLAATDARGEATAVITEGALVTVGRMFPGTIDRWVLTTIAGVVPGDALVLADAPGVPLSGTGTVTFAGAVEGASSYRVDAACTAAFADDGFVPSLPVALSGCGASLDAVALARAPGGALLAYATAFDVPITGTEPSQTATVALGDWQTDFGTLVVDATNAPAGSEFLAAALAPRRGARVFFQSGSAAAAVIASGGSASLALTHPTTFATSAQVRANLWYASDGVSDGSAGIVLPAEPLSGPIAIDLSADLPPRLSAAELVATGGTFVASWRQAAADPGLDGVVVSTGWLATNGEHSWHFVAPPGTTSLALPPLPAELAAYAPDAESGSAHLQLVAYDDLETQGYAAFKATRLGLLRGLGSNPDLAIRYTSTATGSTGPR